MNLKFRRPSSLSLSSSHSRRRSSAGSAGDQSAGGGGDDDGGSQEWQTDGSASKSSAANRSRGSFSSFGSGFSSLLSADTLKASGNLGIRKKGRRSSFLPRGRPFRKRDIRYDAKEGGGESEGQSKTSPPTQDVRLKPAALLTRGSSSPFVPPRRTSASPTVLTAGTASVFSRSIFEGSDSSIAEVDLGTAAAAAAAAASQYPSLGAPTDERDTGRRGTLSSVPDGIDLIDDPDCDDVTVGERSNCSELTGLSGMVSYHSGHASSSLAAGPKRRGSVERPAAQGRRRSSLAKIPDGIALVQMALMDELGDDDMTCAEFDDSLNQDQLQMHGSNSGYGSFPQNGSSSGLNASIEKLTIEEGDVETSTPPPEMEEGKVQGASAFAAPKKGSELMPEIWKAQLSSTRRSRSLPPDFDNSLVANVEDAPTNVVVDFSRRPSFDSADPSSVRPGPILSEREARRASVSRQSNLREGEEHEEEDWDSHARSSDSSFLDGTSPPSAVQGFLQGLDHRAEALKVEQRRAVFLEDPPAPAFPALAEFVASLSRGRAELSLPPVHAVPTSYFDSHIEERTRPIAPIPPVSHASLPSSFLKDDSDDPLSSALDRIQGGAATNSTSSSVIDRLLNARAAPQEGISILDRVVASAFTPSTTSTGVGSAMDRLLAGRPTAPSSFVLDDLLGGRPIASTPEDAASRASSAIDRILGAKASAAPLVGGNRPAAFPSALTRTPPHTTPRSPLEVAAASKSQSKKRPPPGALSAARSLPSFMSDKPPAAASLQSPSYVLPNPLHDAVAVGADIEAIRQAIKTHPSAASRTNRLLKTPLHSVVERHDSSPEAISAILDACPSAAGVRDASGRTPVHLLWARYVEPEVWRGVRVRADAALLMRRMQEVLAGVAVGGGRGGGDKDGGGGGGSDRNEGDEVAARKARAFKALYQYEDLRAFWDLLESFLRGAARAGFPVCAEKFRAVHTAAAIGCPSLLLSFASALYPEQVWIKDELTGRMALHHFAATAVFPKGGSADDAAIEATRTILDLNPCAASVMDLEGNVPLSLVAVSRCLPWAAIRAIFMSCPSALGTVYYKSKNDSSILPFIMAAVSDDDHASISPADRMRVAKNKGEGVKEDNETKSASGREGGKARSQPAPTRSSSSGPSSKTSPNVMNGMAA